MTEDYIYVSCGDSGYVVGVSNGKNIIPWDELSPEDQDALRSEGLVSLKEHLAMGRRVDACTSFQVC